MTQGQAETPQGRQAATNAGDPSCRVLRCIGGLVIVATVYGLVAEDAYRMVSDLTRQTWRAQDAVTLLCAGAAVVEQAGQGWP